MVDVRQVRELLGLTQAELGLLLGVHAVTVCRWETGALMPSIFAAALLLDFQRARERMPALDVRLVLQRAGAVQALYELLHAARCAEEGR